MARSSRHKDIEDYITSYKSPPRGELHMMGTDYKHEAQEPRHVMLGGIGNIN